MVSRKSTCHKEYICYRFVPDHYNIKIKEFPLGALILALVNTPTKRFESLKQNIQQLIDELQSKNKQTLLKVRDYLYKNFVFDDVILSIVLYYLPISMVYSEYARRTQEAGFTQEEYDKIYSQPADKASVTTPIAEQTWYIEATERQQPFEKAEDAMYRWTQIVSLNITCADKITSDDLLFDAAIAHLNSLLQTLTACVRLSTELASYLEHLENNKNLQRFQLISNGLSYVSQVPTESKAVGFALSFDISKTRTYPKLSFNSFPNPIYPNTLYFCHSIYGIIGQEILEIKKRSLHFKRCSLCNKFFLPRSKTAKYCHRPNPNYKDKPCIKVGCQLNRRKTRQACPATAKFDRLKGSYQRWCKRSIAELKEHFKEQSEKMSKNALQDYEKFIKEIENEINDNRFKWEHAAEAIAESYSTLSSSDEREELLSKIVLPSVHDRSPLFYLEVK